MGNLKCPHCGSKDCKEREITLDKIADVAVEYGIEAIKSVFSGGRMNYQRATNNASTNLAFKSGLKNKKNHIDAGHVVTHGIVVNNYWPGSKSCISV